MPASSSRSGGVAARVDDDRLGRRGSRAHDVAVRPDRAELVTVDGEAHGGESNRGSSPLRTPVRIALCGAGGCREIETPDGSRSPVVLHSSAECRAVLIGLHPGQELGDHQVKEHAFIVVVDGTARIEAGEREARGRCRDDGRFEPDRAARGRERTGAKILLILAPWPGEGHYRGDPSRV